MYRIAIRAAPRHTVSTKAISRNANRFISTAPPAKKSRSWKSAAARWGLAGAGLYYYNTSNVFAEEPEAAINKLDESIHHIQESSLPTVDAVMEEKRRRKAEALAEDERKRQSAEAAKAVAEEAGDEAESEEEEGLGGLEEEAGQQGAFNPETGEINWDCPCLGGMAHGPCGDQFKEAFSCFVYSTEEPKGVECIEKFKGMQDCFRQHPEMYGSELEGDEDEVEEELRAREAASSSDDISSKPSSEHKDDSSEVEANPAQAKTEKAETEHVKPVEEPHRDSQSTTAETTQHLGDEGGELVPRATHDATSK